MPFVSHLRKEMFQVLENKIIPALKTKEVPLAYVSPALQLPEGISTTCISKKVLSTQSAVPGNWPVACQWPDLNLLTKECPNLEFAYEGFADERVAALKETPLSGTGKNSVKGIYALHLPAPSVAYIPPGIAHLDGQKCFWERANPRQAYSRLLYLRLFPTNVLAHLCATQNGEFTSAHVLQIHDRSLASIAGLFAEELRAAPLANQELARTLLLALMQALRRNLLSNNVQLTNSAWPRLSVEGDCRPASPRSQELCASAVQFIQLHLHEKLTLEKIARYAQVTPQHLNQAFRQVFGITVMRHVTLQRVDAAKLILSSKKEYIQDVAQLVGYERFSTFCNVFCREMQMSPGEYRRRMKRKS